MCIISLGRLCNIISPGREYEARKLAVGYFAENGIITIYCHFTGRLEGDYVFLQKINLLRVPKTLFGLLTSRAQRGRLTDQKGSREPEVN